MCVPLIPTFLMAAVNEMPCRLGSAGDANESSESTRGGNTCRPRCVRGARCATVQSPKPRSVFYQESETLSTAFVRTRTVSHRHFRSPFLLSPPPARARLPATHGLLKPRLEIVAEGEAKLRDLSELAVNTEKRKAELRATRAAHEDIIKATESLKAIRKEIAAIRRAVEPLIVSCPFCLWNSAPLFTMPGSG